MNQVGMSRAWPLAVTDPGRESDGDTLQILGGCVATQPVPIRAPGGQAVAPRQEEVFAMWPVPARAEGRDQSGTVAVAVV